ncbi:MAG: YhgE/Pip family protein, partial [Bacillota bacterium]|nr:YhgE/Pip family protein [Bacillota bacterium]
DPVDPVNDYGTAFAPYFISLSLWVGALIMFVMIYLNPQMRFKKKLIKNMHMDIKFLLYPALGVAQAVGLGLILTNALHLKLNNPAMFYVVITLISLCFISIEQFLIVHLGDIGKFVVIMLLILQLTSSGGTFPNELVPKFFNVINGAMPMTYSIYALKETISGSTGSFLNYNVMVLAVTMIIFLAASLFLTGRKKAKSIDEIESEIVHRRESSTLQG